MHRRGRDGSSCGHKSFRLVHDDVSTALEMHLARECILAPGASQERWIHRRGRDGSSYGHKSFRLVHDDAFSRQVHLKSGGYIVVDETEALVAIDVNTGRHKGGKD